MRASRKMLCVLLAVVTGLQTVGASRAQAEHWLRHMLSRVKPLTSKDPSVETLAKEIDYLEHHIDTFGTVVPKQPDVWGQARLTKHRQEIEAELSKELGKFRATLQGAMRRSDQAFLGMALALGAAAGGQEAPAPPDATTLLDTEDVIDRNGGSAIKLKDSNFEVQAISLEPTIYLDQLHRYLNHLQELRRINEGDDTADSPGYSLNLVRIPISIIPGKLTRKGYGAEITITAQPYLGENLLPMTFRNLVVNDVTDQLGLPITKMLEEPGLVDELRKSFDKNEPEYKIGMSVEKRQTLAAQPRKDKQSDQALAESLDMKIWGTSDRKQYSYLFTGSLVAHTAPSGRRSLLPYPNTQIPDVFGRYHVLGHVVVEAAALAERKTVSLLDVEKFLRVELNAAYDLLELPEADILWRHCAPYLASAIHARQRDVDVPSDTMSIIDVRDAFFRDIKLHFPRAAHTTTVSLAWAIIVDAALLNKRLMEDMRELEGTKGCRCLARGCEWMDFYLPDPSPEARASFNDYVSCRWPIIVFALDPVTDDQNIADVFSRRREMQLALSVGVAQGTVRGNAAMQFMRRLETDIETIALNRTAVGFSHGSDTFGWRFYPRIQTPDTSGTIRAVWETISGGPTRDQDIRQRQLEPAIRECDAVVIMPSFVPYVTFDSRANWFSLTHPRKLEMTLHETMKLSRTYQGVHNGLACVCDSHAYRPGDVARLARVVDQLDRQMPLQSMMVQVPFENQLGGFEMFSTGVTDLGPELRGFYGEPGIIVDATYKCAAAEKDIGVDLSGPNQCRGTCAGTTLFLVGDHFSVHETKVVAGGKCVPFVLMSRQIMRITVPPNVKTFLDKRKKMEMVDVHIATPYGVTAHLEIPAIPLTPAKKPKQAASSWNWAKNPKLSLCFRETNAGNGYVQPPGIPKTLTIQTSQKQPPIPKKGWLYVHLSAEDDKGKVVAKSDLPRTALTFKGGKASVRFYQHVKGKKDKPQLDLFIQIANFARIHQALQPARIVATAVIGFEPDDQTPAPPNAKLADPLVVTLSSPDCTKCCGEIVEIPFLTASPFVPSTAPELMPAPGPAPAAPKPPAPAAPAPPETLEDTLPSLDGFELEDGQATLLRFPVGRANYTEPAVQLRLRR